MTNEIEITTAHADSLRARIAHEIEAATMTDANVKKLQKTADFFAQATVASFLATCEVHDDFANRSTLSNERFDTYSIDSMCSILQFALNAISIDKLKTNVSEVIQTAIKLTDASHAFTQDDAIIALDKRVKIADKSKSACYVRRATIFDSAKRHAQMTINALVALNALKATSRNVYTLNDNELTSKLRERFNLVKQTSENVDAQA